jgi:hypothetical protein
MSGLPTKGSLEDPPPIVEMDEVKGPNRLAHAQGLSPEEFLAVEKKLKRKLDLRLLACTWLIFVMNYLDRVGVPLC